MSERMPPRFYKNERNRPSTPPADRYAHLHTNLEKGEEGAEEFQPKRAPRQTDEYAYMHYHEMVVRENRTAFQK